MVNLNGKLLAEENATLSIKNRGFAFGDSVFETLRIINSKIIFWEDHYFRLMASMRIMRMEIPQAFSPEYLEDQILQLIEANNLQQKAARVRFSVFRKEGGLYTPATLEVNFSITAGELASPFYLLNDEEYEVELYKDHFCNSGLLSTLKTNNRAINVLGSIFAKENNYRNCFLLNERKNVIEALNANIFLVSEKTIKTPPITEGCINGVLRKNLIDIIKKTAEYNLIEEPISAFELQKADEIFLTNVIVGIQPVSRYRKKSFESKVARDLLAKLNVRVRLH